MCQLFDMTIGFALFIPIEICKGGELAILHGLFPFAADLRDEIFIIMSSTFLKKLFGSIAGNNFPIRLRMHASVSYYDSFIVTGGAQSESIYR